MSEYRVEIDASIVNNEYKYYKLYVDGVCHYEEYIERIKTDVRKQKDLAGVIRLMELLSARTMLPNNKFRQIKGLKRTDVFEFKKNMVRVYVIKQPPYIYVVLADDKNKQDKSISKVDRLTKDFPENYK